MSFTVLILAIVSRAVTGTSYVKTSIFGNGTTCAGSPKEQIATRIGQCDAQAPNYTMSARLTCDGTTCELLSFPESATCQGQHQVAESVVADGSCQAKAVQGVTDFYQRSSVVHSVADAISGLAPPIEAVFLGANCAGDPAGIVGFGACMGSSSGSMKITCPIGTANATESEVCMYTDESCQVPNLLIPCTPSPTTSPLGCTRPPHLQGGSIPVSTITFCTDTLPSHPPSHPPAGGDGSAHTKTKLSADDDAGIVIGVLAVIGVAVVLGLYATKWRNKSKYGSEL